MGIKRFLEELKRNLSTWLLILLIVRLILGLWWIQTYQRQSHFAAQNDSTILLIFRLDILLSNSWVCHKNLRFMWQCSFQEDTLWLWLLFCILRRGLQNNPRQPIKSFLSPLPKLLGSQHFQVISKIKREWWMNDRKCLHVVEFVQWNSVSEDDHSIYVLPRN